MYESGLVFAKLITQEEEYALPPLGLLAPIAQRGATSEMRAVLTMTERLKKDLPQGAARHVRANPWNPRGTARAGRRAMGQALPRGGGEPAERGDELLTFGLVVSGPIKLRAIGGWRKIAAVLSRHTAVALHCLEWQGQRTEEGL